MPEEGKASSGFQTLQFDQEYQGGDAEHLANITDVKDDFWIKIESLPGQNGDTAI